ncbi:MAG: hypothetical protein DSZ11_04660 [Sulfurovum sp.]|nr:MAG: hypothetical protein DSZ11_04660 [Sulfurovum sp.]
MNRAMSRELKIGFLIIVLGIIGLTFYWFDGDEPKQNISERIVLPNHDIGLYRKLPKIKSYLHDVQEQIKRGNAVLPLMNAEMDAFGIKAQAILLQNRAFLKDTKNANGALEHNDMMSIRPAISSVLSAKSREICKTGRCYQALKYNFVTNTTTRAIVDVEHLKVLEVKRFANMQPDISLRLKKIAQEIALNAPEIKKELGATPKFKDMSMANVRGSLNNSACENENHLCVAPTFSYHDKEEALWAIIDLTDLKLAAAKWAGLGKTSTPACIAERTLQNRQIMENFCQKDSHHTSDGWKISYRMTGSDGLEVFNASFHGEKVIKSAKIVDWHVAYKAKEGASSLDDSIDSYVDGRRVEYVKGDNDSFFFGYNDAMGCPMFSTSVVLPFNAPRINPLLKEGKRVGFYLLQDYRNPKWPMACNYRYENRFEFYDNGSFRVVGVNKGRGCGKNAIYRPVMRIDMEVSNQEEFYSYEQNSTEAWNKWLVEGRDFQREATRYFKDKYLYKIVDKNNAKKGYYIEPNRGQFTEGNRGDHATIFVTLHKENEGEQDLMTLGSCCKLSEEGVERYLEKREDIEGKNIVFWYVPRVRNDAREGHEYCWADTVLEDGNLKVKVWPCDVGPMFVPIVVPVKKQMSKE